jgi:HTH-type transcriptional regulator / antitoxin HigA
MDAPRQPAEMFPPGDFLGEEMAERGLDVEWLCQTLRCDDYGALALLRGERALNALEAGRLGRALGTGPELWMNLEATWQSWKGDQENARAHGWRTDDR